MTASQTIKPQHDGKDLLFFADVQSITSLNTHTLYRYARSGKMPAPIKIGNQFAWYECEILHWISTPPVTKKILFAQYIDAYRTASNDENYSEGGKA